MRPRIAPNRKHSDPPGDPSISERIGEFILIGMILLAPLPLASVDPVSGAIVEVLAFTLFVLYSRPRQDRQSPNKDLWHALSVPLIVLIGYGLLQSLPLPSLLIPKLAVVEEGRRAYGFGFETLTHLSVYPGATLRWTLGLAAGLAVFSAAYRACSNPGSRNRILLAVIGSGFFYAAVGIVQKISLPPDKIYGIVTLRHGGTPFGPFVNRNHFAAFMLMTIPVALSFAFPKRNSRRRGSSQDRWARAFFFLFLSAMMIGALIYSGSLGGIVIAGVMALSSLIYSLTRYFRRQGALSHLAGILAALAALVSVSFVYIRYQPEGADSFVSRLSVWKDSLSLMADFPLFGVGFSNFNVAFPAYKSGPEQIFFRFAENEYIQFLVEGGAVGALILIWLAVRLVRSISGRRAYGRRSMPVGFAGAGLAVLGLLAHSSVDFDLRIPALSLTFAVLAAVTLGDLSRSAPRARTGVEEGAHSDARGTRNGWRIASGLAGLLALYLGIASLYHSRALAVTDKDQETQLSLLSRAHSLEPWHSRYLSDLAILHTRMGLGETGGGLDELARARRFMEGATRMNPLESAHHRDLGWIYFRLAQLAAASDTQGDDVTSWEAAETEFRRAVERDPTSLLAQISLARFLAQRGRNEEALKTYGRALVLETGDAREILEECLLAGNSPFDLARVLPNRGDTYIDLARTLDGLGEAQVAGGFFKAGLERPWLDRARLLEYSRELFTSERHADTVALLESLKTTSDLDLDSNVLLGHALFKSGRRPEAIEHLTKLSGARPDNASILSLLASFHYSGDNPERAAELWNRSIELDPRLSEAYRGLGLVEERGENFAQAIWFYERALYLDPENPDLQRRLERLKQQ